MSRVSSLLSTLRKERSVCYNICVFFAFSHFFKPPVTTRKMSSSSNDKSKTFVTFLTLSFSADKLDTDFLNLTFLGFFYYGKGCKDTQLAQWRSVCCHLSVVQVRELFFLNGSQLSYLHIFIRF